MEWKKEAGCILAAVSRATAAANALLFPLFLAVSVAGRPRARATTPTADAFVESEDANSTHSFINFRSLA